MKGWRGRWGGGEAGEGTFKPVVSSGYIRVRATREQPEHLVGLTPARVIRVIRDFGVKRVCGRRER